MNQYPQILGPKLNASFIFTHLILVILAILPGNTTTITISQLMKTNTDGMRTKDRANIWVLAAPLQSHILTCV